MGDDSQGDEDKDRPARVASKYRNLADYHEEQRRIHARKTVEHGYSSGLFKMIADQIQPLSDSPGFAAIERAVDAYDEFSRVHGLKPESYNFDVSSASFALATSNAYTAMASTVDSGAWLESVNLPLPPGWDNQRNEQFALRMESVDPELGSLARGVWQTFYAGHEQAPRNALASMRQLYDHFFHVMAPDSAVRKSVYFKPKEGDKADQVQRPERIAYAAATHIADRALATTLLTSSEELIATYQRLNQLHERRALDAESVRRLLIAMQAELEQWLYATTSSRSAPK